MIISHKHKFIFIKTRKTAGTSIEVFLSNLSGKKDIVTPIYPPVDSHEAKNNQGYYNHIKASEVRKQVGERVWNQYFKFCVERNPWDKTASYYYMLKSRDEDYKNVSFEDFILSREFCSDYESYSDDEGKIIVDRVLQYSELSFDLNQVFCHLGIPFSGDLGVRCKSEYKPCKLQYKDLYSPSEVELVSEIYSREISQFGYVY